MKKCKWAGDASDEYCKSCDGITMMVDGNSISCEECAGYEEGTEEVATTSEEVKEEPPINPPMEEKEEVKEESKKEEPVKTSKSAEKSTKKEKTIKSTPVKENVVESQNTKSESITSTPDGVNVLALRYMSGVTICHNDTYYKFSAEEEWQLDINIFNTTEKVEEIREKLWAKLNASVDKQVEDVIKG